MIFACNMTLMKAEWWRENVESNWKELKRICGEEAEFS